MLKRLSLTVAVVMTLAPPVSAQSGDGFEEGLDLFSEGARRLMEGFAIELAPLLLQLDALIDEITAYSAPEILENGDIIIRRKPDAPEITPPDPEDDSAVDL